MNRKSRVVLIMAIVGLLMAMGSGPGFGPTTVQADHIKIFDMNDRHASKDYSFSSSGVAVVKGNNIDFKIVAEGLSALDLYTLSVMLSIKGPPVDGFAMINYEVVSDTEGKLSFEKDNFNLDLLPAGEYRVDWMITHATETDAGRTDTGKAIHGMTGLDPILTCQPAMKITVTD